MCWSSFVESGHGPVSGGVNQEEGREPWMPCVSWGHIRLFYDFFILKPGGSWAHLWLQRVPPDMCLLQVEARDDQMSTVQVTVLWKGKLYFQSHRSLKDIYHSGWSMVRAAQWGTGLLRGRQRSCWSSRNSSTGSTLPEDWVFWILFLDALASLDFTLVSE